MDLSNLIGGAADLALFSSIRNYIYSRIDLLTEQILSKNLTLALSIILALLTVWIMIQGYLIATGRSQEGLKGFVFSLGKSYFIITMALGVASGSSFALRTLTETLSDGISEIMTDSNEYGGKCLTNASGNFLGCKIDQNLTLTQGIMGFINTVDTVDDPILERQVDKAKWFAGLGSAGPGVVAGTMMIMYRIAMALFVGFAPIFILSLLFKKTAPLFQRWLYYGLATIFSSVLLGVMSDIATDLVTKVATSLFVGDRLLTFAVGGSGVSGIMEASTQQLGLGLILSTLLITVPPMAGMWFNGVMGSASGFNTFVGWGTRGGGVAPGSVPPSIDNGRSFQTVGGQHQQDRNPSGLKNNESIPDQFRGVNSPAISPSTDNIKTVSAIGYSPSSGGNQLINSTVNSNIAKSSEASASVDAVKPKESTEKGKNV